MNLSRRVFGVFAFGCAWVLSGASPVPSSIPPASNIPSPSSVPSMSAPSPTPVPVALPSLTPSDVQSLLREFLRAQKNEIRALEHRNKFELKELKSSQSARLREWENKEKDARHKFFEEHPKGPDRRTYIQDFIQRRETFSKLLADEKAQRVKDLEAKYTVIKQEQSVKLRDFKKELDSGRRPSLEFWPGGR